MDDRVERLLASPLADRALLLRFWSSRSADVTGGARGLGRAGHRPVDAGRMTLE
jgi:hypothetical protein